MLRHAVPTALVVLTFAVLLPRAPAAGDRRAPAIVSDRWLNSQPLTAIDLKGRVVVVEFWTFGCINCIRTAPAMRQLRASYAPDRVVVVGIHTPEFEHEKNAANVERAIARLGISYPVAMDNDFAIWRRFDNRYWPALYVIDRRGVIRHTHVGELHQGTPRWSELLELIDRLLKEPV